MELGWMALGLLFMISGAIGLGLTFLAVAQGGVVFVVAVAPALLALGLGLLITFKMAFRVIADDRGLTMAFAWRSATISWQQIRTFRKLFIRMSLMGGEAGVYTFVTFQGSGRSPGWALLVLRGEGPAPSLSASEYETDLDKYVSGKRIG
jgi:hypothetical protein